MQLSATRVALRHLFVCESEIEIGANEKRGRKLRFGRWAPFALELRTESVVGTADKKF